MKFLCGYNFSSECDYIFSRGHPKTVNGFPVTIPTGEYDVFCRDDLDGLNDLDLVFCKIDNLPKLSNLLSSSGKCIYLITHDSDYEINEYVFSRFSKNVKHWWGVNVNYEHPNLSAIPLGIGSPWVPEGVKPNSIVEYNQSEMGINRDKLLYVNHRIDTYPAERTQPYQIFKNASWVTLKPPSSKGQTSMFIQDVLEHKFVLCPRGNGIDTYRFWESLYLGAIPVVKDCLNLIDFKGLPFVTIESYDNITEDFLNAQYEDIKIKKWQSEKLNLDFWMDNIRGYIYEDCV